jgi:hypothetical protein
MSLPIKPGAIDPSMWDSLTTGYLDSLREFEKFLINDPQIGSPTTSARTKYSECEESCMESRRDEMSYQKLRHIIESEELKMSRSDSEYLNRAMDIRVREEISAWSEAYTPAPPSRSSTVPSSLSGESLLTSFLSTTSASNSKSPPSGSRSGRQKLLSSPSKAIPTKSSTRS